MPKPSKSLQIPKTSSTKKHRNPFLATQSYPCGSLFPDPAPLVLGSDVLCQFKVLFVPLLGLFGWHLQKGRQGSMDHAEVILRSRVEKERRKCICTRTHAYIYIYICIYIYVCVYISIYIYICVCVYIYIYIYVCVYIYIYVCVCIYLYICVHICMYIINTEYMLYMYIYTH